MSDEPRPRKVAPGRPLPSRIVRLGWVSFFMDVSSEMIHPVVPLFLTAALGAPMVALGFVEGFAEAVVSLMKALTGWRSDRLGRRVPYVRWGYGLSALSKPLTALAYAWPMVLVARSLDRFGKGLRTTARDAMIADVAPSSQGGRAYGFHRMMDTAGAILGVLLATGLLALMPGRYRTIFLIAALPGLASVLLTLRLREAVTAWPAGGKPAGPAKPAEPGASPPTKPWSGLPGAFWASLAPLALFAFANSSDTLLILRAKSLGLTDVQSILAYTLYNVVYAASAYPIGMLSDRLGRWRLIVPGWLVYAAVYLGFAWADAGAWVWWLFPVYGLYMGMTDGVGRALIRDHIPDDRKGTAMGLFHMTVGLTSLAGSVTAGLVWDLAGPRAPFVMDGVLAAIAAVAVMVVRLRARSAPGRVRETPGGR